MADHWFDGISAYQTATDPRIDTAFLPRLEKLNTGNVNSSMA